MTFTPDPARPLYGTWQAGWLDSGQYTLINTGGGAYVSLTGNSLAENSAIGTTIGTLAMNNDASHSTWTFAITNDPDGAFQLAGTQLKNKTVWNYEQATSHTVQITASASGQTSVVMSFTIQVINVPETTLTALSLSSTSFVYGVPATGTINGATSGSTITVNGVLPVGLTVNGAARTWSWSGTGSPSSGSFNLVESYYDAINNNNSSTINYNVTATMLGTLALSSTNFNVGTPLTVNILGATSGSAITGSVPPGFSINSTARTLSYDGTGSPNHFGFTLTETLATAYNSPKTNNVSVTIAAPVVTLGALTLAPSTNWTVGTAASGTINGATVGSTIAVSGQPLGFTISSAARTWAYDGSGSASTGNISLTETLSGATNSPNASTVAWTLTAAPVVYPAIVIAPVATLTTYPIQISTDLALLATTDQLQVVVSPNYNMSAPVYTSVKVTVGTSGDLVFPGLEQFTLASGELFLGVLRYSGDGSQVSAFSNILKWGDVTAPVLSTTASSPISVPDWSPISIPVTFNEPCYVVFSGPQGGAFQVAETQPGTSFTIQLVGNGNTDYNTNQSLTFTVQGQDLGQNLSNPFNMVINVIHNPAHDPPFDYSVYSAGYDISVANSLFQDTAGTIPAVNDGDPVRRVNDLSGNGNHLMVPSGGDYWVLHKDSATPLQHKWISPHSPQSALSVTTPMLYTGSIWQRMTGVLFDTMPVSNRVWCMGDGTTSAGYCYFAAAGQLAVYDGSGTSAQTPITGGASHTILENHSSGQSNVKVDTSAPPAGSWCGNTACPGMTLGNHPLDTGPGSATPNMRFFAAAVMNNASFGANEDLCRTHFNYLMP